ncbi:MAG: hypothetical protein AUK08_03465 [Candidatus Pacebacteria bacterium CG2_30_36_39]|nr:hypothetical protein [Candidatus Pacearchaeota archaeon]OIP73605.1 MAG: hypothetical protein AUK08_03465 [Candidatus Pacebacteria bacterium CG2_30_36_39]
MIEHRKKRREEIPGKVQQAFDRFFEMGVEAQDLALPLIEEATIQRGRFFPKGERGVANFRAERAEGLWEQYILSLGDKLAKQLDSSYWPGHGANSEATNRSRNMLILMLKGQTGDTLLQTKELIELVLDRRS